MNGTARAFGRQIKILRHESLMTQEELARIADISVSFLGGIEAGRKSPTIETVEKLADALNISVSLLFLRCENDISYGKKERIYKLLTEYTEKILYLQNDPFIE